MSNGSGETQEASESDDSSSSLTQEKGVPVFLGCLVRGAGAAGVGDEGNNNIEDEGGNGDGDTNPIANANANANSNEDVGHPMEAQQTQKQKQKQQQQLSRFGVRKRRKERDRDKSGKKKDRAKYLNGQQQQQPSYGGEQANEDCSPDHDGFKTELADFTSPDIMKSFPPFPAHLSATFCPYGVEIKDQSNLSNPNHNTNTNINTANIVVNNNIIANIPNHIVNPTFPKQLAPLTWDVLPPPQKSIATSPSIYLSEKGLDQVSSRTQTSDSEDDTGFTSFEGHLEDSTDDDSNIHEDHFTGQPKTLSQVETKPQTQQLTSQCEVALEAVTSYSQFPNEDSLTYLNKGQIYLIKYTDKKKRNVLFTSTLSICFHETRYQAEEEPTWRTWQALQPNLSLKPLEIDKKASTSISRVENNSFNSVQFTWNGRKEVKVAIKVNCLSTEFLKAKGVKGIQLRLQSQVTSLEGSFEYSFCRIKVFRDKGAERKNRDDQKMIERKLEKLKENPNTKICFEPPKPITVFSPMPKKYIQPPLQLSSLDLNAVATNNHQFTPNSNPNPNPNPNPICNNPAMAENYLNIVMTVNGMEPGKALNGSQIYLPRQLSLPNLSNLALINGMAVPPSQQTLTSPQQVMASGGGSNFAYPLNGNTNGLPTVLLPNTLGFHPNMHNPQPTANNPILVNSQFTAPATNPHNASMYHQATNNTHGPSPPHSGYHHHRPHSPSSDDCSSSSNSSRCESPLSSHGSVDQLVPGRHRKHHNEDLSNSENEGDFDEEKVCRKKKKAELCILIKKPDDPIYSAVYLGKPTCEELLKRISERLHLDSGNVGGIYRISKKGLTIQIDDSTVEHFENESDFIIETPQDAQSGVYSIHLISS